MVWEAPMSGDTKELSDQAQWSVPQCSDASKVADQQGTDSAATQAILVLGMHRSGTSATAGVIAAMGAFAGDESELLPAHPQDNPTGYWERGELVREHDRFLEATGHSWKHLADFNAQTAEAGSRRALAAHLRELVDALNASGGPWLIKDPRLSLLLPVWLPIVGGAACVVVVRDPAEIAASLRNTERGVFGSQFPVALWEKYTRSMLDALDGRPALFVSYPALLADPDGQILRLQRGLEALGVHGLHPIAQPHKGVLDPDLHRSQADAHIKLDASQTALFGWLDAQARAPGPVTVRSWPQSAHPDRTLAEFEAAFAWHAEQGRAQARNETAAQLQGIEHRLLEHANERENWRTQLTAQHQQLIAQQQQITALHEQVLTQQRELATQHRHIEVQDQQIAKHLQQIAEQRQQLVAERERIAALTEQVAVGERVGVAALAQQVAASERERHAAHLAFEERIATLGKQLEQQHRSATELSDAVRAMRASWSWKVTAPLRAFAGLFAARAPVAAEQRLYRLYYAIPGLNVARKRAAVLWLHRHAPWLTRRTLSYRLYQQTQELLQHRAATLEERARLQRMDAARAEQTLARIATPPLISIAMPVYNVDAGWLQAAVDSVRRQFYPHWQLCIADDASTQAETVRALRDIERLGDARIKIRRLRENLGIAGASNAALELATGDYVGLLDNDDMLTRDALLEMALRIDAEQPDLLYSDEDKLDENGAHVEPHFKPDYNEDYLFSINYVCHFSVIRRALLTRIGGFRAGFDGAQDYDLLLRATEQTQKIAHIPKVLYHWRRSPGSTAASAAAKPQTSAAGLRALTESLKRRGIDASAGAGPFPNTFNVRRSVRGAPLVSILVPFRDKPELLDACIGSILEKSRYRNFEIIGIDNNSAESATHTLMRNLQQRDARVRFVRYDAPFNYSAINNFGARAARGEHLLFLNNDTEVISADWLDAMLEHSQRPEVGVVGAKLLYADNTLQHAGVIVGLGGVAGHAHLFLAGNDPGYFARAQLTQQLSAVTFACAMSRREVFERLGGLNEQELCIAFNDIDYCMRAREAGFLIVYTPNAVLYHYESKSRGYEDTPEKQLRFGKEIRYMQQRHAGALQNGDPHYNPNLSLTNNYQPNPAYADELPL